MNYPMSILRTAFATLAAVALLGLAPDAQAQPKPGFTTLFPGQPRVSVGARAGLSVASLSGDDVDEAGSTLGFTGGLVATVNVNPLLAVQVEGLYTQKGASVDEDGETPFGTGEQEIRLGYVEVPVLLRVAAPLRSAARPHLYVGPSFGFNVSASRDFDDGTVGEDDDLIEDEAFEDAVAGTDIGLVFGGGLDVRLPVTGKVTLDARYSMGLGNVFDDEVVAGDPDVKNRAFQVSLGFGL